MRLFPFRSQQALKEATDDKSLIDEALSRQNDTLDLLADSRAEFEEQNRLNSETLRDAESEVDDITSSTLLDINKQVS